MHNLNEHLDKPCKFLKLLGYDLDAIDMKFRCDQMGIRQATSYGMFQACYYCDNYEERKSVKNGASNK